MLKITPSIGEVEEIGKRAVEAGKTFLDSGSLEDLDRSIAASKEFDSALTAHLSRQKAWDEFQALLADALDLEENEAFDEHYGNEPLPCEVDEVDPWEEDREAAETDLQADAQAQEIEGRA